MTPDHDLRYILRRCEFACEICGWHEQSEWFSRELNGYYTEDQLPNHRIVTARFVWVAKPLQNLYERLQVSAELVMGRDARLADVPTQMEISAGIDGLRNGAANGFAELTEDVTTARSSALNRSIAYRRIKICSAVSCMGVLEKQSIVIPLTSHRRLFCNCNLLSLDPIKPRPPTRPAALLHPQLQTLTLTICTVVKFCRVIMALKGLHLLLNRKNCWRFWRSY